MRNDRTIMKVAIYGVEWSPPVRDRIFDKNLGASGRNGPAGLLRFVKVWHSPHRKDHRNDANNRPSVNLLRFLSVSLAGDQANLKVRTHRESRPRTQGMLAFISLLRRRVT
jgi:hypothetical protein